MISVKNENARSVRSKEMFEVEPARGDRPIFQTVWDFTNKSNEKIPLRLFVLIKLTVICIFFHSVQISDGYSLYSTMENM